MIKLTYDHGEEFFANPARIVRCGNNSGAGGGYVLFVGEDRVKCVRESGEAVARLVAEAQRPTTAVDLEAVATARRVLLLLSDHADTMPTGDRDGFGLVIYNGLHLRDADWPDIATTLRALAARLGGAS